MSNNINEELLKNLTDENIEKLIELNMGLVRKAVNKLIKLNRNPVNTRDDLMSIGMIALYESILSYDSISYQCKFSTYAYTCIKNKILKELGLGKYIPDVDSLDRNVNEDSDDVTELVELIDNGELSVEDEYAKKELSELIIELLKRTNITEKEKNILKDLYGLNNQERLTYSQVARKYNYARQSIYKIENQILRILRNNPKTHSLRVYIGLDRINPEDIERSKKFNIRKANLFDRFPEYSREEIVNAVKKLSKEQQEILHRKFGPNLDSKESYGKMSTFEYRALYQIYKKIRKCLEDEQYDCTARNNKKLFERISEYSEEQIRLAVSMLDKEDQDILHLRFGDNLDDIYEVSPEISKKITNTILRRIRIIIKNGYQSDNIWDIMFSQKKELSLYREIITYKSFKSYLESLQVNDRLLLCEVFNINTKNDNKVTAYSQELIHETILCLIYNYYLYLSSIKEQTYHKQKIVNEEITNLKKLVKKINK